MRTFIKSLGFRSAALGLCSVMALNVAACSSPTESAPDESYRSAPVVVGASAPSGFDQEKFEHFQGSVITPESAADLDRALGVHTSGAVWSVAPPALMENEIVTTLGVPGESPLLTIRSPRVDVPVSAQQAAASPVVANPKVTILVNGDHVTAEGQIIAVARSLNRDAGLLDSVRALDAENANSNTAVHPEYFGWSCALSVGITLAGILITVAGAVLAYNAGIPATMIGLACLSTIGVAVRVVVAAFVAAIGIAVVGMQKAKTVEEVLAYGAGFVTSITVALQNIFGGLSTGAFAAAQACLTTATAAAGLLVAGLATTIVGGIQVADACFGVTGSPSMASCAGSQQDDCTATCNAWAAENGCVPPDPGWIINTNATCSAGGGGGGGGGGLQPPPGGPAGGGGIGGGGVGGGGSGASCACIEGACLPPQNPGDDGLCQVWSYRFDDDQGFGGTEGDAVSSCLGTDGQDEFRLLGSSAPAAAAAAGISLLHVPRNPRISYFTYRPDVH